MFLFFVFLADWTLACSQECEGLNARVCPQPQRNEPESEDGAMSARPHNPEGAVKMDFFRRHLFASGIFASLPYFARCSSGLKTRVIKEKNKNWYRQKDESIPPLLSNWRDTVEPLVSCLSDILPVKKCLPQYTGNFN